MNIHSSAPTDPDAFLRWNEGREGKRELVNGKVVEMMTGATYGHARRVRQLSRALEDCLDSTIFEVVTNDIGVKTYAAVRYPDILVDRAGNDPGSLVARAPVLIVEVLSPSSVATDMVEKAAEYTAIPTVQTYLVLSQDEPRGWLWTRDGEVWVGPSIIAVDGVIRVPALALEMPLRTIYSR